MMHSFRAMLLATLFLTSCAKPVADFVMESQNQTAPAEIRFSNQSRNAETVLWEFGDGDTSTLQDPRHIYRASGNYDVRLTVTKGTKTALMQKRIQITAPEPCLVEINTPQGRMLVELFNETPKHRDNFMKLVEESYYDSLLFHRVIRGFMIQGGDPNSRGADMNTRLGNGGPGYQIDAEITPDLVHLKGALCAARMGDAVNPYKRSSGSQFYLVQGNRVSDQILDQVESRKAIRYTSEQREAYKTDGGTPHLDGDYTVFGRVIEGLEVIDAIAALGTNRQDRPLDDVWMTMRVIK